MNMSVDAQENTVVSQFRGDNHAGIYNERDLLKKWPEPGPPVKWIFEQIGNGYGSPSVTHDRIIVQGEKDSISWVYCLDLEGNLLWKKAIGQESMTGNWTGSFSTPTVVNELVYVLSTAGDVACLKTSTGDKVWDLNMIKDLKGKMVVYGFSQSLLVDEDLVFCSPGGTENNIVALNRFTGEVQWTCPGIGEEPRCSPVIIKRSERNILVTTSTTSVVGIDRQTGELLWAHVIDTTGNSHYNTPLFDGENLYCFSFYDGKGVVRLSLSEDGRKVTEQWRTLKLLNSFGGLIKIGNYLIGTHKNTLLSLDAFDGHLADSLDTGGQMGGATIYADGMIYLYDDFGIMMLVTCESGKLNKVSSFRIIKGTRNHFAHPVIKNGNLYIRHGRALIAFSVSK